MQVETFLIPIIVIFVLLLLPIFVNIKLYFNVLENLGVLRVGVFGFSLIKWRIKFNKKTINILTNKKQKNIPLDFKDEKIRLLNKVFYRLFLCVAILRFELNFESGKKNDAFTPSILCGLFNSVVGALLGFCYTKKGVFCSKISSNSFSNKDKLCVFSNTSFVFNVALILFCVISAKLKQKKRGELC